MKRALLAVLVALIALFSAVMLTEAESPTIAGDVDCNGDAGTVDALFVLSFVAELPPLADCISVADSNGQPSGQTEAVNIGSLTLAVADQGSLDLGALNIAAPGLGAWSIDIVYDPAVVSALNCVHHAFGGCNEAYAADTVRLAGADAFGLTGDTALASITFMCVSQGISGLVINLQTFVDTTGSAIDATIENGSVTCTAGPVGDVNCDGLANSIDAALVLQLDAGLIASLSCLDAADVNADGSIDSMDTALILQFDVGLIDSLPPQ